MADGDVSIIIKAKDVTKAVIGTITDRLKNFAKALKNSNGEMDDLSGKVRKAVPALLLMNSAMGEANGMFTKALRSVSSVASAFAMFGPGGAIVAGVKAGIDAIGSYFVEKAEKMLEKAKELGAKMTGRLERLKELRLEHLANDIERAAKGAERAAKNFEKVAEAAARLAAARAELSAERESGEIAELRNAMVADLHQAELANQDGADRDVVKAAWTLKIAEREAEIKVASAERERRAEAESLALAERRAALAEKNAKALEDAAAAAGAKHEETSAQFGELDPRYVAQMRRIYEQAREAAERAHEDAEAKRAAADAAAAAGEVAEARRSNGINAAYDRRDEAVWAYERAEREHARRIEADEAERQRQAEETERIDMERRIAAARKRLETEIGSQRESYAAAEARLAAAQAQMARAWGWYRNRDSLKAQIEEEKANALAEKQFEKDFERLKWRRDWRTAENLSLDQEAVRRVALAREEEESAAREVAQINAKMDGVLAELRKITEGD